MDDYARLQKPSSDGPLNTIAVVAVLLTTLLLAAVTAISPDGGAFAGIALSEVNWPRSVARIGSKFPHVGKAQL